MEITFELPKKTRKPNTFKYNQKSLIKRKIGYLALKITILAFINTKDI